MCSQEQEPAAVALAIETSGALGSVAIGRGDAVLEACTLTGDRRHAVELLPTIRALCDRHAVTPSAIDRVYVSVGPGSFTGLRIGVTVARMIALTTGAKVVAVPTLDVIARNVFLAPDPPDRLCVLLDAKRGNVYAAVFERRADGYAALTDAVEASPEEFLSANVSGQLVCAVTGGGIASYGDVVEASAWDAVPEALHVPCAEAVYELGVSLARQGRFHEARSLTPTYIRPPEAEERWRQRQQGSTE